jgi:hypothetical protein
LTGEFGLPHPNRLLIDSLRLPPFDQYWLRLTGREIAWFDVNHIQNGFAIDLGEVLLGELRDAAGRTLVSPGARRFCFPRDGS